MISDGFLKNSILITVGGMGATTKLNKLKNNNY